MEINQFNGFNSPGLNLRALIDEGIVVLPGAFNAAVAMVIQEVGFQGVYVSGAGLANGLAGVPDIGLLTQTEVLHATKYIADAIQIPIIVDIDTGFGEPLNVMRTIREFEKIGVAGVHLEDQVNPKKCGHLDGKMLVSPQEMVEKIKAAVSAKVDPDFLLIARTDARTVEGIDKAIERANKYLEAGADAIFTESLSNIDEFKLFRKETPGILLANMTEFGKTDYITVKQFEDIGYNIVIFPMTTFRLMMKVVKDNMIKLKEEGTQVNFLNDMQTREELYKLLKYEVYKNCDDSLVRKESIK